VGRKLEYPHHYQTRSRGLDEAPTELVVTNEEEDSDTEASGSWAVTIPRYDNHEVPCRRALVPGEVRFIAYRF
jgi:hypothetical protein